MLSLSRIAVAILAIILSACASGLDTPVALETKTRDDAFLPYVAIAGKTIKVNSFSDSIASSERLLLTLLARRDRKTGVLTTHAKIEISYTGLTHRRYGLARNDRGEQLAMSQLNIGGNTCRKDPYCIHHEDFLVDLPEPDVRAAQDKGYAFKVFTKAGAELYFPVPQQLIKALFAAADAQGGAKAAAAGLPEVR